MTSRVSIRVRAVVSYTGRCRVQEVLQDGEEVGHAVGSLAVAPALDDARLAVAGPSGRLVE
jgi:methenyltetrahydromethanopterin cyclohydrolase